MLTVHKRRGLRSVLDCLLLLLLLCAFDVRVDTVISRNGMNEVFCILYKNCKNDQSIIGAI